jgi:hypothetical protein
LHSLAIFHARGAYLAFAAPRRRRSAAGAKQRQEKQN